MQCLQSINQSISLSLSLPSFFSSSRSPPPSLSLCVHLTLLATSVLVFLSLLNSVSLSVSQICFFLSLTLRYKFIGAFFSFYLSLYISIYIYIYLSLSLSPSLSLSLPPSVSLCSPLSLSLSSCLSVRSLSRYRLFLSFACSSVSLPALISPLTSSWYL